MRFGAVIAAAGLSGRMGVFKPLLPLGHSTFIERIVSTLLDGGAEEIAVVTGRDAPLIEKVLAGNSHIHFIYNKDFGHTEMFYSVSLGLGFMADRADSIFFTPVDVPLFGAQTVHRLGAFLQNSDMHIIAPAYHGKTGHPVAIRSRAVKELINYNGHDGLKGAIASYSGPTGVLEADDTGILYDFDTPEDYRLAVNPVLQG
ncbi:MAG: nucleotidyltransferase family protein [Treponema sp.]|jgi:CTP:molybdopterin cytidylyltransferase MocA|nr:nucleotidyltransferase family protein [Treponema sp.]